MALVLDTGPAYATLDRRDAAFERTHLLLPASRERLVVPAPVLVEVDQLVSRWLPPRVFVGFLDDIAAGAYQVEELLPADYQRIGELCARYADLVIGFVDAAVLAVVERLNEPKLATLDHRHFGLMRPRHIDALRLLPD